jgi:hypothetical protein
MTAMKEDKIVWCSECKKTIFIYADIINDRLDVLCHNQLSRGNLTIVLIHSFIGRSIKALGHQEKECYQAIQAVWDLEKRYVL